MDIIKKYSLTLVATIESHVDSGFSIDSYLETNAKLFSSVVNGMNDENFKLEDDFEGNIAFSIFKMNDEIDETPLFLQDAKEQGYIFTGVKGIASILLQSKAFSYMDSWILSPHKIAEPSKAYSNGMPYLSKATKSGAYLLHYSNNSVNNLRAGMYILLAKKQ